MSDEPSTPLQRVLHRELRRQVETGEVVVPLELTVVDLRPNLAALARAVREALPELTVHDPWSSVRRCNAPSTHPHLGDAVLCQLAPDHDSDHCWFGSGYPTVDRYVRPYRWPRIPDTPEEETDEA